MNGLFQVVKMILTLFVKNAASSPAASQKKAEANPLPPPRVVPEIAFKNDSGRLKGEFSQLNVNNPELRQLLQDVNEFCYTNFKKNVVITMIYRTQEEQDAIYKDDPKYKTKKFTSPHQIWSAADLRSLTFSPEEIKKVENFINEKYNGSNVYKWTAKDHTVPGGAPHFHVQYKKKG